MAGVPTPWRWPGTPHGQVAPYGDTSNPQEGVLNIFISSDGPRFVTAACTHAGRLRRWANACDDGRGGPGARSQVWDCVGGSQRALEPP